MKHQRMFAWLMFHDRVLTKMKLASKGLGIEEECHFCHVDKETPLCLLRDCHFVAMMWRSIIPNSVQAVFFQSTYET